MRYAPTHNLRALFAPRHIGRETVRRCSDGSLISVWRWDVRIENEMLGSIVFFYGSEDDANDGADPLGTGFCVWLSDDDSSMTHVYLVTNEHVIRSSAPLHVVRGTNHVSGKTVSATTSQHDWMPHPDGDDLAVCYLGCNLSCSGFGGHHLTVFPSDTEVRYGGATAV